MSGIDDNGNQIAVNHLNRHTLSRITKDDWLLIASALVEIPNHVLVTQDDVDEYEKSVVVPVGVKDNAMVSGNAIVCGNVSVSGNASIYGLVWR